MAKDDRKKQAKAAAVKRAKQQAKAPPKHGASRTTDSVRIEIAETVSAFVVGNARSCELGGGWEWTIPKEWEALVGLVCLRKNLEPPSAS